MVDGLYALSPECRAC